MARLRRVSVRSPGYSRAVVRGTVRFTDTGGAVITDPAVVARCESMAIPPAWTEVWICPQANGHIQAFGRDDAGRGQYLYHPQWNRRRERAKHDRVLEVARRLPSARRTVARDLRRPGMPRRRALALAFRLLDLGYFRVGGERYARQNGSVGLATLRAEHVQTDGETGLRFRYPGKSGQARDQVVADRAARAAVAELLARGEDVELLAWRDERGWRDVSSDDVLGYVKDRLGEDATAKDFRTWHATVLAARELAAAGDPPASQRARRGVVADVVRTVAAELGNTPAVCRASYIDPRVIDLWEQGERIPRTRSVRGAEKEVMALLS